MSGIWNNGPTCPEANQDFRFAFVNVTNAMPTQKVCENARPEKIAINRIVWPWVSVEFRFGGGISPLHLVKGLICSLFV